MSSFVFGKKRKNKKQEKLKENPVETVVLAKILTAHNVIYFVLSTFIAAAIVNKSKLPNWPYMLLAIPASWIGLVILSAILGGLFKLVVVPLLVIGFIVVAAMYLKKKSA